MTPEQHERAMAVIRALNLPEEAFQLVERKAGYQLEHADGRPRPYIFGYVRLNQDGDYTMYAYRDFWDPDGRFQQQPTANTYLYRFDPDCDDAMNYALRAVRSSFERSR